MRRLVCALLGHVDRVAWTGRLPALVCLRCRRGVPVWLEHEPSCPGRGRQSADGACCQPREVI